MKKIPAVFAFLLVSVFAAFAQNKFEGYNIVLDVPENHKAMTCTIRYMPATTNITISDLNPATPMKLRTCAGNNGRLTQTGSTATMQASPTNNKWCFEGEDKKYRISFRGDQWSGMVVYDWVTTPDERNIGFYNVKDFGAVGDGKTDDTVAIRSAMAFLGTRNGGTLMFPEGEYMVGNVPDYKGIVVPSGVNIQGVSGIQSNSYANPMVPRSPSRITLTGQNRALFKIGECTERLVFKDIELYALSNENTYGFEAVGAFMSSQDFYFERVVFSNFFRGIYGRGLPATQKAWQFDYIKINHCRFIFNRDAGIWNDTINSDWKIQSSLFINPKKQPGQNADSMNFVRAAAIVIEDTYGGGFPQALGGTYLKLLTTGNVTLITSQTEAMTNSIVLNEEDIQGAGDYSYPITILNSIFHNPIDLKGRRTIVSVGSFYGPQTFKAGPLIRIYSTGDRFCYDGGILGCQGATRNLFDKASVLFMTGQPGDFGRLEGYPTYFGTDVQFGSPVQMPSMQQNQLPKDKPNGSMVYCENCRRSTTPCQAGGSGAPAMVVGNQWSCL
jgi:hypothetical protein